MPPTLLARADEVIEQVLDFGGWQFSEVAALTYDVRC
jgi:hypothetical protein